jgi:hypothetical protein
MALHSRPRERGWATRKQPFPTGDSGVNLCRSPRSPRSVRSVRSVRSNHIDDEIGPETDVQFTHIAAI